MGKSKTGGAFGFIKKSIGSVTYSTMKDKYGKRVQILRAKPTDVTNPNTVAQILQRMKVRPASRFYAEFEEILNNAFEGVAYGAASRREFMALAMKAVGPYIPRTADRFIPAKWPVSRGSVAEHGALKWLKDESVSSPSYTGTGFTYFLGYEDFDSISEATAAYINSVYGRDVQLTFIAVTQTADGSFETGYARKLSNEIVEDEVLQLGNAVVRLGFSDNRNVFNFFGGNSTSGLDATRHGQVVAAAVITSYKDGENWVRSNVDMAINPALELNLYGADAKDLAIESYQDAASVNNLNSSWYLNLANGQQYPGNLSLQTEQFGFSVSEQTVVKDLTYPYGSLVDPNGRITYQVFADASGDMIFNVNGQYTTVENPENAGHNIKWSDIQIQSRLYGYVRSVETWKTAYVLQIEA